MLAEAAADEEALLTAELSHDDSNLDLIHREVERLYRRLGVPERFRAR